MKVLIEGEVLEEREGSLLVKLSTRFGEPTVWVAKDKTIHRSLICSYCGSEIDFDDPERQKKAADHALDCDKRPERKMALVMIGMKEALEAAEHELTTHGGLIATDKTGRGVVEILQGDSVFILDTTGTVAKIDAALKACGFRK